MSPARRRTAAVVAAGGAGVLALALGGCGGGEGGTATAADAATTTAPVTRTTLVSRELVSGTLGYAGARSVLDRLAAEGAPGTVTATAPEGATRRRGETLYRVDGVPVRLLYGAVPAYRELAWGDEGSDVRQLERNLKALGHDPGAVDGTFDGDTYAAVYAWQGDAGWTQTGRVALGQVVFLPGARRIGDVLVEPGDVLAGGTEVMTTTTGRRVVTVDLEAEYQELVHRGDAVTISLPGGAQAEGRIAGVGTVAQAASSDDPADTADAEEGATVELVVRFENDADSGRLDGAPVSVGLASDVSEDALAVPVTALLARTGGGYAVEVADGAVTRRVDVEVGQFADGLVAITGGDLAEGDEVVIPDGVA